MEEEGIRCLQWEQQRKGNKEGMERGTKKGCKESDGQVILCLHIRKNKVIKRAAGNFLMSGEREVVFTAALST